MNPNPAIEEIAKTYYDPGLPYHNFNHIGRVMAGADRILIRCRATKLPVNEDIVYYAVLFHDAGYRENHTGKGFATKEAYSAQIAERVLSEKGVDPTIIPSVKEAILGTQRDATLHTIEQKIVRAADLSAMASDYRGFRKDAEDLRTEYEILNGKKMSTPEWKQMVASHVEFYLSQIIHITSSESSNTSEFHIYAKDNLERLLKE